MSALQPGIYDFDEATYHADPCPSPSLSNSIIRALLECSPRHAWFRHPRLNPGRLPQEDPARFDLGTCAHKLLLEGESIAVQIDAPDWRTKAAQQARDEARAKGLIPLLPQQFAALTEMVGVARDYIAGDQLLHSVFANGAPEQTLIWQDERAIWCRGRIDFLSCDGGVIVDYKTTSAPGPAAWIRGMMVSHGYDTQSVFYPRGLAALGVPGTRFVFLVQEDSPPYACYRVESAPTMIELAETKVRRAIKVWGDCLASNHWPGYSADIYAAEAPMWALREQEMYA